MNEAVSSVLYCSVLGPLEVRVAGRKAVIGAPKQRLLLTIMLCRVNMVVPSAQLIDALWGEFPPRTARKNLQVYVSSLRKIVGDRIDFQGWGYCFHAQPDELDLLRFHALARAGRNAIRSGDLTTAAEFLGEAIQIWAEQPLAEFAHVPLIAGEAERFTEQFLSVYEDWVELEIELGRHVEALAGLDLVAARFPARERIAAAKMTALVRCGRTAEALAHFQTVRRHLAVEMGIDPSRVLQDLHQEILAGGVRRGRGGSVRVAVPRPGRLQGPANQLPRDIADFVGREAEMRRIVTDPAAVTVITGELGIGKTALAMRAAHTISPAFPDGALMVTLRRPGGEPRPAAEMQRELLEAAGLDVTGVHDDALGSLWRSWLSGRSVLLVLDDAPDESAVRPLLPGASASKVLVTSRSRLSGLEAVDRVGLRELSGAEGIEFLGKMIGAERVRRDLDAVMALFDRYGLSPLTLRLLGGRFARLPRVPLSRLADRLARAECVLDEFAAGDVSLRERFEQHYNRPSWAHRAAFRALGALHGPPFEHDELVAALHGGGTPAERVIEAFLEANILSVPDHEVAAHSMLYTMSPLAHRYAAELRAAGR
ncbi:DNA-binding SARP family transcriptional activator [Thermocatellispora tengchongensis]|uniref:DNA-binding SARP family transcriptional activator n=1 Tax=Thermocatellispora tengchongensis TaxID=1073253 RepID=A0A840PBS1_9ACTN|nr:BTAD domain-containing putative transcriptional regulator [Thermocatellispora tengchongensis]MBB5134627.1 DNA-binding SARP family transcriptional activator [Thermocatellispora tengchongensis]